MTQLLIMDGEKKVGVSDEIFQPIDSFPNLTINRVRLFTYCWDLIRSKLQNKLRFLLVESFDGTSYKLIRDLGYPNLSARSCFVTQDWVILEKVTLTKFHKEEHENSTKNSKNFTIN